MLTPMLQPANTILVVDDMPVNVRLLSRILNAEGYRVQTAADGLEALARVEADPPDLILLDIQMPEMDGYEVCERLKADERFNHIPIMFISALTDTEGIVKALQLGGVDYITKPFKVNEVTARVSSQLTLVNQRKQIEALREQDRRQFEALNAMKTQFINMAVHDIKNPLGVVWGYAELLETLTVPADQQELLDMALEGITRSAAKMRQLVTDILDLAQIDTGVGLAIAAVALTEFLSACLQSFAVAADQKSITLTFEPPAEELFVPIDATRMERVIANLVSNAIKYTPDGGSVTVAAARDTDHAVITVTDTGLGIPADDLPYIFDTFYRVKAETHRTVEGTGLGLAIVKRLVEQHGGTIEVTSELHHGSCFEIRLPMASFL